MTLVPYVNFTDVSQAESNNGRVQVQTTPEQRKKDISINRMRTSTIILSAGLLLVTMFAIANFALVLQVKNSKQPKIMNLIIKSENWYEASNGKMYKVFDNDLTFTDAMHSCESLGGRLASAGIRDKKLKSEIISGLGLRKNLKTWIGLRDVFAEGQWKWLDGVATVSNKIDWMTGQPSNFTQFFMYKFEADCVLMSVSNGGKLEDEACNFYHYYMCEV
uniref:C-type lectin lectoxin-Lio2-like isoform X1 n=2 Tax=Styela clava TaxID=7725 RepID=UPI00193A78B6|nr:C-type lectin lectoxin-Lio2-like isoform X1 [Styela clava]